MIDLYDFIFTVDFNVKLSFIWLYCSLNVPLWDNQSIMQLELQVKIKPQILVTNLSQKSIDESIYVSAALCLVRCFHPFLTGQSVVERCIKICG